MTLLVIVLLVFVIAERSTTTKQYESKISELVY